MTEEEFTIAIHAIAEYTITLEAIRQESDRLKAEVKEHMKAVGLTETMIDGRRVRLQETHRSHLDAKTLKRMQPTTFLSWDNLFLS